MRDLDYPNDIKIAGLAATEFLGGASLDAFLDDPKTQAACMRQLEIIGEAVKRLSDQTKKMLIPMCHGVNGQECEIS